MSFGGSVAAMINTLKNNARMLRERSYMSKDELQYFKKKPPLEFVKSTPEEIERIRKMVIAQHRLRKKRILITFGCCVVMIITGLVLVVTGVI